MKKYLNCFIIFLFIFASCLFLIRIKRNILGLIIIQKTINIIEFEYIKKKILVNDTISNMQIFEKNDSLFLIALKRGTNKILKYDLNNNTKKLSTLIKKLTKIFNLYPNLYSCPDNIKYINKDTIFFNVFHDQITRGNHGQYLFQGSWKKGGKFINRLPHLKGALVPTVWKNLVV